MEKYDVHKVALTNAEKAYLVVEIKKLDLTKDAIYAACKSIINAPTLAIGIPE
ncbi:hypothetical protein [Liquorilactobacillus uvarum]|uniref:hypothetical protein n=1 Tax=Liquorilactobacillus uvarum TaxID=303240 RepID=UPI0028899EE5|nr:hypothetical protein [Liquorilactobacillus uvarum]